MTSLDLFAGAGGMTVGFRNAGIESVGAIEVDQYASATFRANFPGVPVHRRDIRTFGDGEATQLFGGVDVIAGGPPCQGFSSSGPTQHGVIDARNTLVMEFFRFVDALRPRYAVLENVKGILTGRMSPSQRALRTYLDALVGIGYESRTYVLQAADFGVPQSRTRVIVISATDVGDLPDAIMGDFAGEPNWVPVRDVFGDLPAVNAGEGTDDLVPYLCDPLSEYQRYVREGSSGVTNHVAMRHTKRIIERFSHIPQGGSLLDAPPEFGQRRRGGTELDARQRFKTNNQRLHPDRVSPIVTASFQSTFVHPYLDRNLTAREAARLQSFPDSFSFRGPRTLVSKSFLIRDGREDEIGLSQYNQIGNAVPPRLAEGVARALLLPR